MIDYKTILRLHSEKFSLRQIAARVGNSHHTVKKVIDVAAKSGVVMPLGEDVTNRELEKFLFPDRKVSKNVIYAEPDYPYIHKELSKKGVTLTLLWNEYCERCRLYTPSRRSHLHGLSEPLCRTLRATSTEGRATMQKVV